MDPKSTYASFVRARSKSQPFRSAYQLAAELAAPQINTYVKNEGGNLACGYSSMPARAANTMVANLISNITPQGRRWIEPEPSVQLLDSIALRTNSTAQQMQADEQVIRTAYERINRKVFQALDNSNFYKILPKFYRSAAIGTACMQINHLPQIGKRVKDIPFEFIHVPASSLSLLDGVNGKIYGVFREVKFCRYELLDLWPDADPSALPSDLDEFNVVEACIYHPLNPSLPWSFNVIYCQDDNAVGILKQPRRLAYNPFIVFRWDVVDGETMGRGPILYGLADVLSYDKLTGLFYMWLQTKALGTIVSSEQNYIELGGLQNRGLQVGGITYVSDVDSIRPLTIGGDLRAADYQMAELAQGIRQMLGAEDLPSSHTMTAYETQQRANRILQQWAPVAGSMQDDFINPLYSTLLRILQMEDFLQIPDIIGSFNTFNTNLVLKSPLGRSQQLEDLQNIRVGFETIASIRFDNPLIQNAFNPTRTIQTVWECADAPFRCLNTPEEANKQQAQQIATEAIRAQSQNPAMMQEQ